jgi:hypothetical protein
MQQGQMTNHLRRGLVASALCGLVGCYGAQIQELTQKLIEHQQQEQEWHRVIEARVERERMARELEDEQIASRVECHNDRIRDFLKECEQGSEVCSEQGMANAFWFIITQPFTTIYLRPQDGVNGLMATRRGQLASMGDPKSWLPSTRFLILAQPRSDTPEHYEEALRIGREIQRFLVNDLFKDEKRLRILGPKILPCKMKQEELSQYLRGKLALPIKGEPTGHQPTVRLFVFKTDC